MNTCEMPPQCIACSEYLIRGTSVRYYLSVVTVLYWTWWRPRGRYPGASGHGSGTQEAEIGPDLGPVITELETEPGEGTGC